MDFKTESQVLQELLIDTWKLVDQYKVICMEAAAKIDKLHKECAMCTEENRKLRLLLCEEKDKVKEYKQMNSCYTCKHRHSHKETESWEMSHVFWWEHYCEARPTLSNLKQFPFNKTNCKNWEPSK